MTEDEMVGWHHQLNRHEFAQTQGNSEGQGSLACCSPWGHKDLDMTEQLNNSTDARHRLGSFTESHTWDCAQGALLRTGMRLTSVALPEVGKEISPHPLPVTRWPAVVQPLRNPVGDQICPGTAQHPRQLRERTLRGERGADGQDHISPFRSLAGKGERSVIVENPKDF